MSRDYVKGLKHGLGFLTVILVFLGIVYAVGFHSANEIIGGVFQGNYTFNGSINFTNSNNTYGELFTQDITEETNDIYTLLLIHSDEPNVSITFTDSSSYIRTVNRNANTYHSTSQKKIGNSSIYFDGADDTLHLTGSSDLTFSNTDSMTIDFWFKLDSTGHHQPFLGGADWSSNGDLDSWLIDWCYNCGGGVDAIRFQQYSQGPIYRLPMDTNWHHIALVGINGYYDLYVDGIKRNTTYVPDTWGSQSTNFYMGTGGYHATVSDELEGYLDEIRVSKGIARWTEDFTPPTLEYGTTNRSALYYRDNNGIEYKIG